VGILAGWGRYPGIIAQALRRQGIRTYCLGVIGHAQADLSDVCDEFEWIGLGKIGRAIRYFKSRGVTEAVMVGKIHKVVLFQPWRWVRHLPDARAVRMFVPHFLTRQKDCRDDSLLRTLVEAFAAEGIHFRPATDFAPELLVDEQQLSRRGPTPGQWKDIEFGWEIAKRMGRLDIGQSVVVKDQAVIAVEAVEGTDLCIRRAGTLCSGGGFTVVKTAKPGQDMRFDVPTVGMDTLRTIHESGGRVLAVEADRTILLEQPELVDFANRNKLIVVALIKTEEKQPAGNDPPLPATAEAQHPVSFSRR
jgi:DUF1009 family protein